MSRTLSVIIPTKGRQDILGTTLDALVPSVGQRNAEIIVVNDSKTEGPVLKNSWQSCVRVIDNMGSGAASARNWGAAQARGELLLFLDNDIIVGPEQIAAATSFLESRPGAAMNPDWVYPADLLMGLAATQMGRLLLRSGMTRYRGWVPDLDWSDADPFRVGKLATFFLLMELSTFEASGGFDERFKNQGVEDFEFSRRLMARGVEMFIHPGISVLHNSRDKVSLESQLQGMSVAGRNRRLGVEMGMTELAWDAGPFKIGVLTAVSRISPPLKAILTLIPNKPVFDFLYRALANKLFAAAFMEAYCGRPTN